MSEPCPSCPDGNEWNSNGPTGRACRTCGGTSVINEEDDDGSPYCECGNQPMEDELASNKCDACGKAII